MARIFVFSELQWARSFPKREFRILARLGNVWITVPIRSGWSSPARRSRLVL
jgi:hypothetical protein